MPSFTTLRIWETGYTEYSLNDHAFKPATHKDILACLSVVSKHKDKIMLSLMPSGLFKGSLRLLRYSADPFYVEVIKGAHMGTIDVRGITDGAVDFKWPPMLYKISENNVQVYPIHKNVLYKSPFPNDTHRGVCMPKAVLKEHKVASTFVEQTILLYEQTTFTEFREKSFDDNLDALQFWQMCIKHKQIMFGKMTQYKLHSLNSLS